MIPSHYQLRWDHADTDAYCDFTLTLIRNVYDQLCSLQNDIVSSCDNQQRTDDLAFNNYNERHRKWCLSVNLLYKKLVDSLNIASSKFIPRKKRNFFKFWWDEEAETLKQNSIETHRQWNLNGKPKTGVVYYLKKKSKYHYKSYIRQNKHNETLTVSDSLHDSLLNKDPDSF